MGPWMGAGRSNARIANLPRNPMSATLEGLALQSTPAARKARAAVARAQQAPLTLEDIDIAGPRADEVLVRMVATGICHTDVVCLNGFPVPMPIVLGHEGAGVVEAVR